MVFISPLPDGLGSFLSKNPAIIYAFAMIVSSWTISNSVTSHGNSIKSGIVTDSDNIKSGMIISSAGYGIFKWVPAAINSLVKFFFG